MRFGEKPRAGWTRINDSMFRVLQHSEEAKGMVLRGEYHMPPEAARVLNNYLAPGLRGNPLYDAFRGAGNMLNQSQLGFSAFHAMFADLEQRIKAAVIVPYDLDLCKEFGRVKLSLAAGRNVPANDLWIAACAIRHSIPLVTHNAKDFAGIPRLTVISESPRPAQARSGDLFKRWVSFGPPALPVYEQPICPGEGYIWTPGFWDYADDDYYWVPGTWVEAPQVGYLWTPGYWGEDEGAFNFHEGYWGEHVGFYGGIDYGYGYGGRGYEGGRWDNGRFFYNTSVNRVNETIIRDTYNTAVINNNNTRVSYNGGNGRVAARPTAQEATFSREQHVGRVAAQNEHIQQARSNPQLRASNNQGKPPIAATAKPADFKSGVVPARQAGRCVQGPSCQCSARWKRNTNGKYSAPKQRGAPQ